MTATRGRYAKGEQRRERILAVALEVFTEGGFHASSTKEIARRVGVTEPTLFHYFGSKQALLAAVLAARDERAGDTRVDPERLRDIVRDNAEEPDLVRLYAVTSAEATDPEHAAHGWFARRYARLRAELARELAGRLPEGVDPDRCARLLLAAADGLQVQWLLDRSADEPEGLDMAADLDALLALLAPQR